MQSILTKVAIGSILIGVQISSYAGFSVSQESYDNHVDTLYWAYMVPDQVTERCIAAYPALAHKMRGNLAVWRRHNKARIDELTLQWAALVERSPSKTVGEESIDRQAEMNARIRGFPNKIMSSIGGARNAMALESCTNFSEYALGNLELDPLKGIEGWLFVFGLCETTHMCNGIRRPQ